MAELVLWAKARQAIAECYRVDEVVKIRNQAEVYRYAFKQANEVPEVIRQAEEIKLRAERRAGELLKEMKKKGERHTGRRDTKLESNDTTPALSDLGITRDQSSRWQKIADVPEEDFEAFVASEQELSTAGAVRLHNYEKNLNRERKRGIETPLLDGKYRIIYADPPWQYDADFMDKYGHAQAHYPAMSIEELCALPVSEIAEDDSVLFLWATSPKIPQAVEVIQAWGFEFKTSFVWDKVRHNYGYYNSVRHEFLLIGGKGSSTPDRKELHDSVIEIERSGKHSEKPDYFRELIDKMYLWGNRIELFARNDVEGWESWGAKV